MTIINGTHKMKKPKRSRKLPRRHRHKGINVIRTMNLVCIWLAKFTTALLCSLRRSTWSVTRHESRGMQRIPSWIKMKTCGDAGKSQLHASL